MTALGLRSITAGCAAAGLAVAAYLTYVHYAGVEALCVAGGGGGCERVQSSPQAQLAGVPVAVLGLLGYAAILAACALRGEAARVFGALVAVSGFAFSAYLTYAEVFVIEAICQWCVLSALLMTALAVLTSARLLAGVDR